MVFSSEGEKCKFQNWSTTACVLVAGSQLVQSDVVELWCSALGGQRSRTGWISKKLANDRLCCTSWGSGCPKRRSQAVVLKPLKEREQRTQVVQKRRSHALVLRVPRMKKVGKFERKKGIGTPYCRLAGFISLASFSPLELWWGTLCYPTTVDIFLMVWRDSISKIMSYVSNSLEYTFLRSKKIHHPFC